MPLTRNLANPLTAAIARGVLAGGGGGFNPANLFTGGFLGVVYDLTDISKLYQDSARTTLVTAAGDPLGSITDLSGNAKHASQATAGSRPLWQTTYANFDGTDDSWSIANGGITGSAVTVVAALRLDSTGAAADVWGNKAGNAGYRMQTNPAGSENFAVGNGTAFSSATSTLAADTNGVMTGEYSGTTASLRVNGVAGTPVTVTVSAGSANAAIGKAQDFAGSFFKGRLYRIIVINRVLTATERASAERWCGAAAGVVL